MNKNHRCETRACPATGAAHSVGRRDTLVILVAVLPEVKAMAAASERALPNTRLQAGQTTPWRKPVEPEKSSSSHALILSWTPERVQCSGIAYRHRGGDDL